MPPNNVISTTSPDIGKFTSVNVAMPNTSALVPPAAPASAAESTKAISL